ncbi:MAG TPA: dockerin type I repeat-containing protein, partial [Pirellulaceae bacterium]
MKHVSLVLWILVTVATDASAHCNPIGIGVSNNQLTISQGTSDPVGFAATMFLNPDEDCGFEEAPVDRLITDVPGLNITNMTVNSGLFLEPIGRTASGVPLPDQRWFWYWNPVTEAIDLAPHATPLRIRSVLGFGTIDLPQDAAPAPTNLKVADPRAGDLGVHSHIVRYELTGITSPVVGAYGVFARFTSPSYASSEPVLIMLNSGLDATQLQQAALAINYAAGSGDFDANGDFACADIDALIAQVVAGTHPPRFDLNGDGMVNAADVTTWLAHAGAAELPSEQPYLAGDANLDGVVDGSDFGFWNANKFTSQAKWCAGDFTANGVIDG